VSVCACVSTVKGGCARLGVIVFMNFGYGLEFRFVGDACFLRCCLESGLVGSWAGIVRSSCPIGFFGNSLLTHASQNS